MVTDMFSSFITSDNYLGVEKFLESGRDPDLELENGIRPIVFAHIHDAEECFQILLEYGADPDVFEEKYEVKHGIL